MDTPSYRASARAQCSECSRPIERNEALFATDGSLVCPRCFSLVQAAERAKGMRKQARRGLLALALAAVSFGILTLARHSTSPVFAAAAIGLGVLLYIAGEVLWPSRYSLFFFWWP